MIDVNAMVHEERRAFASFLNGLSPAQWEHKTWCDGWDVKHVVAHLVAMAEGSANKSIVSMLARGFRSQRSTNGTVDKIAAGSAEEVFARYVAIVKSKKPIVGPPYVALGEVMIHSEDVRRGLGAESAHRPESHLRSILDHYRKVGAPMGVKQRADGIRLVVTDFDWSVGEGPELRGPAMSLILAITGRPGALSDLGGPGKKLLAKR